MLWTSEFLTTGLVAGFRPQEIQWHIDQDGVMCFCSVCEPALPAELSAPWRGPISVSANTGKTFTLNVAFTDTIADVKAQIRDKEGLDCITLRFHGKRLRNHETLTGGPSWQEDRHRRCFFVFFVRPPIEMLELRVREKDEGSSSRPSTAGPSRSRSSQTTPSATSRPRSGTRRASLRTCSGWSSQAYRSSRTAATSRTTTSRRSRRFTSWNGCVQAFRSL